MPFLPISYRCLAALQLIHFSWNVFRFGFLVFNLHNESAMCDCGLRKLIHKVTYQGLDYEPFPVLLQRADCIHPKACSFQQDMEEPVRPGCVSLRCTRHSHSVQAYQVILRCLAFLENL